MLTLHIMIRHAFSVSLDGQAYSALVRLCSERLIMVSPILADALWPWKVVV